MSPAALMQALLADLTPRVAELKGHCVLASDEWLALQKLATTPAGFLVVLLFDGWRAVGGQPQEPLCRAEFSAFVQVNTGLEADPSAALLEANANTGRPALLDLCDAVDTRILTRTQGGLDCEDHATGAGMEAVAVPTEAGRAPLRAYRLRYTQTYSRAALVYRPATP